MLKKEIREKLLNMIHPMEWGTDKQCNLAAPLECGVEFLKDVDIVIIQFTFVLVLCSVGFGVFPTPWIISWLLY